MKYVISLFCFNLYFFVEGCRTYKKMPKAFSDPSQKLKTTEIEKAAGMFCIQYIL